MSEKEISLFDDEILEALSDEMTAWDLARKLGRFWESSVYQRLLKLLKGGFVKRRKVGKFYLYSKETEVKKT